MKIILALIFSPLWLLGWACGLILSPFWRGLVDGFYYLQASDHERIQAIAQEEMQKRGHNEHHHPQEGAVPLNV